MYKTLVVVDDPRSVPEMNNLTLISFERYLADYPQRNEAKTLVINLCDTEHYLSRGYYCSLLAEARQHKVLPSVRTINDLRSLEGQLTTILGAPLTPGLKAQIEASTPLVIEVFLGWAEAGPWQKLAKQIFEQYPAPIVQLQLTQHEGEIGLAVKRLAFAELQPQQQALFLQRLQQFADRNWRSPNARQKFRWDMAILVNPDEPTPPSNPEAIKRFIKAAAKVGIHAETITIHQAGQIGHFDALFIRETTAIDHPTYRLARKAEQEGLVVIDDPTSILRCCNKVFLHDAFSYNNVPALKTQVVMSAAAEDLDGLEAAFTYPMVIKMPESSFSKGVFKVSNRTELQSKIEQLLSSTAIVLVQEYLYTEFDWRIGVLNGRAIYACRYHMARNHWQIYNHDAKRFNSGGFATLPTFEVPKRVLDAAIKACKIIGQGLYGVDIKQHGQQSYVIEVNDNPSLEHKVEDLYLGNELYMQIMAEFARRLERRGR